MSYLNDLLERVVALEKEAMTSMDVKADAVPQFYHAQEAFPYFTNRIADIPISDDGSEDVDLNSPLVIMRLVVGHITEGYKGQPEAKLYTWLPVIKIYFNERMWLTSEKYPDKMAGLQSARVVNGGGLRVFENAGIAAMQVGAEIQLACTFYESITQDTY